MNDITRPLEVIETEINFYKQQTATGIIEIGKRLIEAKAQLPHGEWGKWLEVKVEFSKSSADKFIKVATEFSNSQSIANLGVRKLFLLLDIPIEEREEFMNNNKVDEMTTRELQQAIKAKKEAEQKLIDIEKEINELKNRPEPEPMIKEVEKIIVPADYEAVKGKFAILTQQLKDKEIEIKQLNDESLQYKKDSKKYKNLQSEIEKLQNRNNETWERFRGIENISELSAEIKVFIREKLAPVKYSKAIKEASTNENIRESIIDLIGCVQNWCNDMYKTIPEANKIYVKGVVIDE